MITDIIASLALVLAVVGLYWQWRDKKPRLTIEQPSITTVDDHLVFDGIPQVRTAHILAIYLYNPGDQPVYIRDVWLVPNNGKDIQAFDYHPLYHRWAEQFTVEPLRGHRYLVASKHVVEDLRKQGFTGEVVAHIKMRSETGKHYTSRKPVRFTLAQLEQIDSQSALTH